MSGGELRRLASISGIIPYGFGRAAQAENALTRAIWGSAALWAMPARPGRAQLGLRALFGGIVPPALLAAGRLHPVLVHQSFSPDLVLVDDTDSAQCVFEVKRKRESARVVIHWTAAASVSGCRPLPGSERLWRHWRHELATPVPHADVAACQAHWHLARSVAGQVRCALPQLNAYAMTRDWLPNDYHLSRVESVHWVLFGASKRPVTEQDAWVRSRWLARHYDAFAAVVAEEFQGRTLPEDIREIVSMMLLD